MDAKHTGLLVESLCQVLAQARQNEPLVLKDNGPSAWQPGWAPERDRNISPPGAEGTAVRSSTPGLAPPAQAAAKSWGEVLEAGLVLAPGMAAPADGGLCTPEPYLHPGTQTCQALERAAVLSSLPCAWCSQRRGQLGLKVEEERTIMWCQTSYKANLMSTPFPGL